MSKIQKLYEFEYCGFIGARPYVECEFPDGSQLDIIGISSIDKKITKGNTLKIDDTITNITKTEILDNYYCFGVIGKMYTYVYRHKNKAKVTKTKNNFISAWKNQKESLSDE